MVASQRKDELETRPQGRRRFHEDIPTRARQAVRPGKKSLSEREIVPKSTQNCSWKNRLRGRNQVPDCAKTPPVMAHCDGGVGRPRSSNDAQQFIFEASLDARARTVPRAFHESLCDDEASESLPEVRKRRLAIFARRVDQVLTIP